MSLASSGNQPKAKIPLPEDKTIKIGGENVRIITLEAQQNINGYNVCYISDNKFTVSYEIGEYQLNEVQHVVTIDNNAITTYAYRRNPINLDCEEIDFPLSSTTHYINAYEKALQNWGLSLQVVAFEISGLWEMVSSSHRDSEVVTPTIGVTDEEEESYWAVL